MSGEEILRRDGYGPTSPIVGRRGAHTRRRITDETMRQFEIHGFHGTSVEGIARAVGISRPTLYQYFESKQQIFRELLDASGRDLTRLVRRIGPLGPTTTGFDNLRRWLGEWAHVYAKYATIHVQWANINTAESALRPVVDDFMRRFDARIAASLASSELTGIDPLDAANALTSTVHRYHYFVHGGMAPARSREEMLDGLAVCMQLMLFPQTPAEALTAIVTPCRSAPEDTAPFPVFAALSPVPLSPSRPVRDVGSRGEATRRTIVDTGARLFGERGYHETNIDDMVAELGLSRGTFYKYFPEKFDLLLELATGCAEAFGPLTERFAGIDPGHDTVTQLRMWLLDYLPVHARYLGVIQVWLAGAWSDPRLVPTTARVVSAQHHAMVAVLGRMHRDYPFDPGVAAIVVSAMLERLPDSHPRPAAGHLPPSRQATADLMAALIDRAVFSSGASSRRT
jgi:AcrR family transcriptional regulator